MKAIFYVKKEKPLLLYKPEVDKNRPCRLLKNDIDKTIYNCLKKDSINGKIIAECDFEVEEINYRNAKFVCNRYYLEILKRSCLTDKQMYDYLKGEKGYAIHIKNLNVFDELKVLSDVCTYDFWASEMFGISATAKDLYIPLTKAPHNMCRVYDPQNHYEKKILIPISSQEAHNILNHEQDVLVRRNVLKEMK